MTVNRTSGLLISSYSFYLYEIVLFKWIQYEQLSLSNLSISLICLWLLPPSFFAYQRRSKWKGNNRLNIDTILRADIVSTLKFLIKGREGVNCNFGTFITPNLRFSMKRPSPTLLQNLLFYGSNSKKLAWNTISNLFWAGVPICNPYELQKTERNGFWVFQGVENWSIGSKWVKWMDQDIAHFSLLRDPLDLWFQIKIPTLLDSYLLLPPTIKNLHKSSSDAYLWSEGHLPILFSFLYTQLLILALLLMTSKNASMTFVLFFNFFCFLFLFSTFLSQISLFNSFVSGRNQKIKS